MRIDPNAKYADVIVKAIDDTFAALRAGKTVVFDSLAIRPQARKRLRGVARAVGVPVYAVVFDVPLEKCLEAQKSREHPVPDDRVRELYQEFEHELKAIDNEDWTGVQTVTRSARRHQVNAETRIISSQDLRDNPGLVAELREGGDILERRVAPATTEIRSNEDGSWSLVGHAAVFDSQSEDLGGFREVIQRGAFRRILKQDGLDVRALFNHDQNQVLGRTINGTLSLREDPTGLLYEVNVANTSYGRDLKVLLERGDVSQSSFAFRVSDKGQKWQDQPDGSLLRTITDFADLLDVSPVTYPAYTSTTSSALTREDTQDSSTRETEQDAGGTAKQPSDQVDSQPRRADDEPARNLRVRKQRLREMLVESQQERS